MRSSIAMVLILSLAPAIALAVETDAQAEALSRFRAKLETYAGHPDDRRELLAAIATHGLGFDRELRRGGLVGLLAERGDLALVRAAVEAGARVDGGREDESNPIHAALVRGDDAMLGFLLDRAEERPGYQTMCRLAVAGGSVACMRTLLAYPDLAPDEGARDGYRQLILLRLLMRDDAAGWPLVRRPSAAAIVDLREELRLDLVMAREAQLAGDMLNSRHRPLAELAARLLPRDPIGDQGNWLFGRAHDAMAAEARDRATTRILDILIERGFPLDDGFQIDHLLEVAAACESAILLRRLLDLGCDPRTYGGDGDGGELIHHCVPSGDPRSIGMLVAAGIDPDALDRRGMSGFTRAICHGSEALQVALLASGAGDDIQLPQAMVFCAEEQGTITVDRLLAQHPLGAGQRMAALRHFLDEGRHDLIFQQLAPLSVEEWCVESHGISAMWLGLSYRPWAILELPDIAVLVDVVTPSGATPLGLVLEQREAWIGFHDRHWMNETTRHLRWSTLRTLGAIRDALLEAGCDPELPHRGRRLTELLLRDRESMDRLADRAGQR